MRSRGADTASGTSPDAFQRDMLAAVSRTFALTIPQLPEALRGVVGNAYLLCRIADTIEDESALPADRKQAFLARFVAVVEAADVVAAEAFGAELAPLLQVDATPAEVTLVRHSAAVVAVFGGFGAAQRAALRHCVRVMCDGMPRFDRDASLAGLADHAALDRYCYHVAGVVGEMLTLLFCDHVAALAPCRARMLELGVSFGQGLQMVNILKDFWEDRRRGVCWLPRDVFVRDGVDLAAIDERRPPAAFGAAYARLIATAHRHLHDGLVYTLQVPADQTGIRRFCLLALGLAVQTLQSIHRNPGFTRASDVKITRSMVAGTMLKTRLLAAHDGPLRHWFERLGRGLPLAEARHGGVPAARECVG